MMKNGPSGILLLIPAIGSRVGRCSFRRTSWAKSTGRVKNWTIRYVVVNTRNWLPGKKVLVSPTWIDDVTWTDSTVYIDLSREAIKNSPEYDQSAPVSRDYEKSLYEHYRRSGYWSAEKK